MIKELHKQLDEIEIQIRRGVEAIMKGLEIEEIKEKLESLKKQKIEIQKKIVDIQSSEPHEYITSEMLKKYWDWFNKQLKTEEGRAVLAKQLLEKVVVYPDGYIKVVYRHFGNLFG